MLNYTTSERVIKSRKDERNALIREHYAKGQTLADIADVFGISLQRIWEIVQK